MVFEALDKLERRARYLRELADDLVVNVCEIRAVAEVWAKKGEVQIDSSLDYIKEERDVLASLLGQARFQAEESLRVARDRLSDDELLGAPEEKVAPELVQTAKLSHGSLKGVGERSPPPQAEPSPPPAEPPPAQAEPPLAEPSPASSESSPPDSGIPTAAEGDGENLASLLERNSWQGDGDADGDENKSGEEVGRARLGRPRSRPAMPAAQARQAAPASGDGAWEEDLSRLLDRETWTGDEDESTGEAAPPEQPRPKASGSGAFEDLLSGYLEDEE